MNSPLNNTLRYQLQRLQALCRQGQLAQAAQVQKSLEQLAPSHPFTSFAQAQLSLAQQDLAAACQALEQALNLDNHFFEAWLLLGQLRAQQRRYTPALQALNQALRLEPLNVQTLRLLIGLLQLTGDIPAVTACLEWLLDSELERQPAFAHLASTAQQSLLACRLQWQTLQLMNGFSWYGLSQSELQTQLNQFEQTYLSAFKPPQSNYGHLLRDPERVLRIGYVSSEWYGPYLNHVYADAWQRHNTEKFIQIAYLDQPESQLPTQLNSHFSASRHIFGLNELAFYSQIQADQIDLLIDLSGLFNPRRLSSFAMRPAPVQINAGSNPPFTLGLSCFDAMFSDPLLTPPALASQYREPVYYLSSFLHYQPPQQEQLVKPAKQTETVLKIGAGASPNKLSDQALKLWAQVLKHLPEAQLTLKNQTYLDQGVRERLRKRFVDCGGDASRLDFEDNLQRQDMISFFAEQDLLLDAAPYGGALTVCDAFWAGVPMVALAGGPRLGDAVYACLSSPELLAQSPDDYLQRVIQLGRQPEQRQQLSAQLQKRLLHSPACQPHQHIQELESHYSLLWQQWLNQPSA